MNECSECGFEHYYQIETCYDVLKRKVKDFQEELEKYKKPNGDEYPYCHDCGCECVLNFHEYCSECGSVPEFIKIEDSNLVEDSKKIRILLEHALRDGESDEEIG
jgi:hypothetical protein